MTLRVLVGAVLLGGVWARSVGDQGLPRGLESLVAGLVKKESRDLGEEILKLVDDRAGTLQKVVRRVVDDKELRGLVGKAVEGLDVITRAINLRDIDGGVTLKAASDNQADNSTRGERELEEDDADGRTFKRKKMMMRVALWMKTLFLGVGLPAAVGVALFAAWKGVTISLLALMLAGIVGLKGLVASASKSGVSATPQHVILSGVPTHHQHYWKRSDPSDPPAWGEDPHRLAYQAYAR